MSATPHTNISSHPDWIMLPHRAQSRTIPLLANWHKTITQPNLLAEMSTALAIAAHQLRNYFADDAEHDRTTYLTPASLHTGIPILHYTYPTANPPDI